MAVYSGTKVVSDGLIFQYDLDNAKSWKGEPVTNLNTAQALVSVQSISVSYVGLDDGWKKYSISGTWSSGSYPYSIAISTATFTGGVAHSAQALIKTNVPNKFSSFGTLMYVNDPNMVSGGTETTSVVGYDKRGLKIISLKREGIIYSTGYANPTTSQLGYISSKPLSDGTSFNPATDFIWVKDIQVEQRAFCTPYAATSRDVSAAISDVSKNKKNITIANLSFAKNTKPKFDGIDDYIDTGLDLSWNNSNSASCIFVLKTSSLSQTNAGFAGKKHPDWEWAFYQNGSDLSMVYWNNSGGHTNGMDWTSSGFFNSTSSYVVFHYVWNGTSSKVFRNGILVLTKTASNPSINQSRSNNVMLGGNIYVWANKYWAGEMPHVKFYNKALSDSEVTQSFEAIRTRYGV